MKPQSSLQGTGSRRDFLVLAATATAAAAISSPFVKGNAAERSESRTPRRIGFVDDYLNNYHANVFLKAMREPLAGSGFVVAGCSALQRAEGERWAEKNEVPWFASAEALGEAVDCIMVLAPATPQTHLQLCQSVLPFGKPTYVDKTFAPDLATAKEIFALADRHRAPIQTSSALRYTNVQQSLSRLPASDRVDHMITWGGGGSFAEYAIHPLELLISVMGPEVTGLMTRGGAHRTQLLVNFRNDRTGVVNVFTQSETPFAASVTTSKGTRLFEVDMSRIFVATMEAILAFFATGVPNVNRAETLAIMQILDVAMDARSRDRFVALE